MAYRNPTRKNPTGQGGRYTLDAKGKATLVSRRNKPVKSETPPKANKPAVKAGAKATEQE